MAWKKEGLADLMRQGFMKPVKRKVAKKEPPVVGCEDCLNWHREGQHTASAEERRRNRAVRERLEAFRRSGG